ncbi:hypothetical protein VTN31DRAFT_4172 [Thermomyces dupontii]|uniref:uncharacterized protein n=1 Tax=Talaromyces thermophilus TaxID=28565 RepID=UPI003742D3E7
MPPNDSCFPHARNDAPRWPFSHFSVRLLREDIHGRRGGGGGGGELSLSRLALLRQIFFIPAVLYCLLPQYPRRAAALLHYSSAAPRLEGSIIRQAAVNECECTVTGTGPTCAHNHTITHAAFHVTLRIATTSKMMSHIIQKIPQAAPSPLHRGRESSKGRRREKEGVVVYAQGTNSARGHQIHFDLSEYG